MLYIRLAWNCYFFLFLYTVRQGETTMKTNLRKTKIVATIGPASESEDTLRQIFNAGVNVCRLNFSHGNHEEHDIRIQRIKAIRKELGLPIGIMIDTKGPEIRLGKFEGGSVNIVQGQEFILTTREVQGTNHICSISYQRLPQEVARHSRILINDGLIELRVIDIISTTDIECVVINNGVLSNNKGVNIPHVKVTLPFLSEKDVQDIEFGIDHNIDYIAASFTQSADDIMEMRKILNRHNSPINIIAKIENQEGMDNINEILEVSDAVMVARGDLGVEIKPELVPFAQKKIIQAANLMGKPVITATQMLESMTTALRPTRAEVTDVANAILDGTSAVMLSGETAAGQYPVETVEMMHSIALSTENSLDYAKLAQHNRLSHAITTTNALARASCSIAAELNTQAIITATSSGKTARSLSKFRPKSIIVAVTDSKKTQRRLSVSWGVYPILSQRFKTTDKMFEICASRAKECGYVEVGDVVVLTAGVPVGKAGTTNLLKVHIIDE